MLVPPKRDYRLPDAIEIVLAEYCASTGVPDSVVVSNAVQRHVIVLGHAIIEELDDTIDDMIADAVVLYLDELGERVEEDEAPTRTVPIAAGWP